MNHANLGLGVGVVGLAAIGAVADIGAGAFAEPAGPSLQIYSEGRSSQACQSCSFHSSESFEWSRPDLGCHLAQPEHPNKEQQWVEEKHWCAYGVFPLMVGWAYIC